MIHEHTPIRKDHEICCNACGIVLEQVHDASIPHTNIQSELIYPGLNTMMLGLSLERTGYLSSGFNKNLVNYQRVLSRFLDITKEYALGDRIAYETMRRLLKKKRGLYSYRLQIKELIDVLNSDYRYTYKARAIREKYAQVTGI